MNLTAQCAGGDAVDTWNWTNATYTTTTGNTATATIAASTTFKVTASNGGGSSNGSVLVSVAGGGGGTIACSGFLNTNVFTATWPLTQNGSLPMGVADAAVVKFTTGSANGNGQIVLSTAGNNAGTTHDYTLSSQSCDFGTGLKQFAGAGAPTIRFTVSSTPGPYPKVLPNTTYYVNIRNSAVTGCSLTGQTCDLYPITLTGPQ